RRSFPSKEFYEDALEDGADIELRQLLTDINTVALVRFSFPICMKGKSLNIRDKLVLERSGFCSSNLPQTRNHVPRAQGMEKDVAIFSCVRANDKGEIGFLSNSRRMNVIGSAATLKSNPLGKNIVESAEKRNPLFKVSKPMNYFLSEENLETMNVTEDMEIPDAASLSQYCD
ncbi:LOW QUALITY PROTEIN: hypothetical protein HID58_080298, partial [Brassica napus]